MPASAQKLSSIGVGKESESYTSSSLLAFLIPSDDDEEEEYEEEAEEEECSGEVDSPESGADTAADGAVSAAIL